MLPIGIFNSLSASEFAPWFMDH